MNYSFPHYLLAKQTVDDRALNRVVLDALREAIAPLTQISIYEVGGGIGTMLARLLRWNLLPPLVNYTLVDEMPENIAFARQWLPQWAAQNGFDAQAQGDDWILATPRSRVAVKLVLSDVFDFIGSAPPAADLLIAHAFLDLLPLPASLAALFSLLKPGAHAWLTVNFDGVTSLEPLVNPALDAHIEACYHQTMDERPSGGDSFTGRRLFGHLAKSGGLLVSAGASDWVVYPVQGQYPAEEAYFLRFILHFFEESLTDHPALDPAAFSGWLAARRHQVDRAELVYIAHQMDFLVKI